jgi:hypothetical protein
MKCNLSLRGVQRRSNLVPLASHRDDPTRLLRFARNDTTYLGSLYSDNAVRGERVEPYTTLRQAQGERGKCIINFVQVLNTERFMSFARSAILLTIE